MMAAICGTPSPKGRRCCERSARNRPRREDLILQRQKNARRIDEIDEGQAVDEGDPLGAEHFFTVIGKKAPAFTVASLAMSMNDRPATRAMPQMTLAAGAPPHSSYIFQAAKRPSSRNSVPGSISAAIRSRP